jgi:hypothetical protein
MANHLEEVKEVTEAVLCRRDQTAQYVREVERENEVWRAKIK